MKEEERRIIIVYDSPEFVQQAKIKFKARGHSVSSIEQAFALVEKHSQGSEGEIIILLGYILDPNGPILPRHFESLPHSSQFVFYSISNYPVDHPLFRHYIKGMGFRHFPPKSTESIKLCLDGKCKCNKIREELA